MTVVHLEAIPTKAPKPERSPDDYLPMQQVTRSIAFEPDGWEGERKEKIRQLFDEMAPQWHSRGGEERLKPTIDALERCSVSGGVALEVGSGTGIQTVALLEHFDFVVSLDLSAEMLALTPRRARVTLIRGDASALPMADESLDAIVCVNAYLFPAEYARVLKPAGRVVFVSTSGEQTPIYLPPEEVDAALAAALGAVTTTTARCGWGIWSVVTRRA